MCVKQHAPFRRAKAHLLVCFDTWKTLVFQRSNSKKGVFFMSQQTRKLTTIAMLTAISFWKKTTVWEEIRHTRAMAPQLPGR